MAGLKGLKKRRRVQLVIAAFIALAAATAIIGYALQGGINIFLSPSQLAETPPSSDEIFRLGGLVEEGSLVRGEGGVVTFRVTDGAVSVPVTYEGVLPDLFGEGEGMIGKGRYINNTFQATEILAKHDESYMPKEVLDALKEQGVYVDPNG